jgi:hypothetical protein
MVSWKDQSARDRRAPSSEDRWLVSCEGKYQLYWRLCTICVVCQDLCSQQYMWFSLAVCSFDKEVVHYLIEYKSGVLSFTNIVGFFPNCSSYDNLLELVEVI